MRLSFQERSGVVWQQRPWRSPGLFPANCSSPLMRIAGATNLDMVAISRSELGSERYRENLASGSPSNRSSREP